MISQRKLVISLALIFLISSVIGYLSINYGSDPFLFDSDLFFSIDLRFLGPPYIAYHFSSPPIVGLIFYFSSFLNNYLVYKTLLLLIYLLLFICLVYLAPSKNRMRLLWFLAPSFILFSANNWDIIASIFTSMSILVFLMGQVEFSAAFLAIASSSCFYPSFLLPFFLLNAKNNKRDSFLMTYLSIFFLVNFPILMLNPVGLTNSYFSNFKEFVYDYSIWRLVFNLEQSSIFLLVLGSLFLLSIVYLSILVLNREGLIKNALKTLVLLILTTFSLYPPSSLWILPIISLTDIKPLPFIFFDLFNVLAYFLRETSPIPIGLLVAREVFLIYVFAQIIRAEYEITPQLEKLTELKRQFINLKRFLEGKLSILIPVLLFITSFSILFFRANEPSKIYFDEVYYVGAARDILSGKVDPNWIHPPLGKELIALGILLLGDNSLGWRIIGIILASLCPTALYMISNDIFKSRKIALLSSLLLLFDPLYYSQSRIAMLDIYTLSFSTLGMLFFSKHYFRGSIGLFLSGVFFGLAVSSKLPGVFPLLLCLFSSIIKSLKFRSWRKIAKTISFLVAIPLVVYMLTYIPAFFIQGKSFNDFLDRQYHMLFYSAYLPPKEPHPYRSQPWEWPLIKRPLLTLYETVEINGRTFVSTISDIGSPLTWFFGLISVAVSLIDILYEMKREELFVMLWFLATWLPYFPLGIQLILGQGGREQFIYYFLQSLPPLFIILSRKLCRFDVQAKFPVSWMLVCMNAVFFLLCYPVISGYVVPIEYVRGMSILRLKV